MILMVQTSVKLTNGSPKLGKPLADRGRSEAGPSPTDFHELPPPKRSPVPGHDTAVGVSTTSLSLLALTASMLTQGRALVINEQTLQRNMKGSAVFSFDCYDSCNWQKALWELKISAVTGIMYFPPSIYSLSTLMS